MTPNRALAAVLAASLLSGCASKVDRELLARDEAGCATGNQTWCEIAEFQRNKNAKQVHEKVVAAAMLAVEIPALIVVMGLLAPPPEPACFWHHGEYYC